MDVRLTNTTATRTSRSGNIGEFYLCKKTKIKANSTNAQRIPPSPSKIDEIRAENLEISLNNFQNMRLGDAKDKDLLSVEGSVG
jgi:hypothetical protein